MSSVMFPHCLFLLSWSRSFFLVRLLHPGRTDDERPSLSIISSKEEEQKEKMEKQEEDLLGLPVKVAIQL